MKNITYINAGAGSGKTFFLTTTFAEHVEAGRCTPAQVIMTTFSEKAAADIKRNARIRFLEKGLYGPAAELDAASIGTVHAIAYRYIQKYWYLLGISARCEVMTEDNKDAYVALTLGSATQAEDIAAFRAYAEAVDLREMMSSKVDYGFWKEAVAAIIAKADSMGIDDLAESHALSLARIDATCRGSVHHAAIRGCADSIFKIAIRWRDAFRRYKKDNSIIEYNDMESYFLSMLKDPRYKAVQDEISESIRYVFVDEFQDSNPKQLEIFDRLSDLVGRSYWVGDPKQAIYGFRASDTALVQALTDEIRGRKAAGEPGFETGTQNVSRRSLKPLVDFSNDIFVNVFSSMSKADVELLPTHRTESLPDGVPNLQHWDGPLKPGKTKKDGTTSLTVPNKAETIAGLASEVRRMLDGRAEIRQVFDKDTGDLRAVRASDIAVLCRTNGDVASVAAEFSRYKIPVVIKGTADAGRMEIRLVLLMLNYILGDAKLLTAELAKLCRGLSLGDILGSDYDSIARLTEDLRQYREGLSGKGVASVVRGLVVRMDLLDRCARWGAAESRRDNLMALVQNARTYEESCLALGVNPTIEGFIAQIEAGEISVEGYSSEGVSVLTYHGSKGLQWPVVILFSLTNDLLSDKQVAKSFLWDVVAVRKGTPTAGNLYPGYYLTFAPRMTNQYNKGVPEEIRGTFAGITGTGCYKDYYDAQVGEGRRLLYVGVTRARDILVCMGMHGKKLEFLTDALGGVWGNPNWEAYTDKKWADGSYQEIWGPGTPRFYYREVKAEDPPVAEDSTYSYLRDAAPSTVTEPKRLLPSAMTDEALVARTHAVCLNDDGGPFRQVIVKAAEAPDDAVGTCIHNVFAAYDPATPRSEMVEMAAGTIARHGLSEVLTDPSAVVASMETLCAFLAKTYGKAERIEHELPFRELQGGQMTVGSIDLVWHTSEEECVLVDFKNLPFADREILDPENGRFVGHYAPQQRAYREALSRAGKKVRATIIYLVMQGRVVELRG